MNSEIDEGMKIGSELYGIARKLKALGVPREGWELMCDYSWEPESMTATGYIRAMLDIIENNMKEVSAK